jgi:hypothetical protein
MLLGGTVFAKDDRLRCRDYGPGGREAELRFEQDDGEAEFRAKWEIDLNQGQFEGTIVDVTIDGVFIGGITLSQDGNQLEGDIEFEGDDFPEAFPDIRKGTPVEIGALFCRFEKD